MLAGLTGVVLPVERLHPVRVAVNDAEPQRHAVSSQRRRAAASPGSVRDP
jgi:hypothetical protein